MRTARSAAGALLGLVTLAAFGTFGCAAEAEAETGDATGDAIAIANRDFENTLREIEEATKDCGDEGCPRPGAATTSGTAETTGTLSIAPLGISLVRGPVSLLRDRGLCETLRPLAGLEAPYFFVGASGEVTAIRQLLDGGVDLVFDLKHQQAALFHYRNHGYSNLVGLEANFYSGYAFGRKANVLDAWSGHFQSATATFEVPYVNIGVGGTVFRSPDNSLVGGAVVASIGLNALGPLSAAEVAVNEGTWTAWDDATRGYGRTLWAGYEERTARVNGRSHVYLQFDGTVGLGAALVSTAGVTLGGSAAATAAAVAALERSGLTYEQMCLR